MFAQSLRGFGVLWVASLWVARLSQITTVPGWISGTGTSRIYVVKASPSIAPLMTRAR